MSSTHHLTYEELASIIFTRVGVIVDSRRLSQRLTTFEEIGVDSLGMLGVVRELEHRRQVDLSTAAQECPTPHQLVSRLRGIPLGGV